MLSSLNNFSARQDASALKSLSSHPVKVMRFYHSMLTNEYYWQTELVDQGGQDKEDEDDSEDESEDESEDDSEDESESAKEADSKPDQETDEGIPDLEMAGVSFPVSGLLVEAGERYPNAVQNYLDRVTDPYGYHNDQTFVDSVF